MSSSLIAAPRGFATGWTRAAAAYKLEQVEGLLWQAVYAGLDASGPGVEQGASVVHGCQVLPRLAPQRKVFGTSLQ